MSMPAANYYTADMVRDLMDPSRPWPRYETVYGELLVSPALRLWHQEIVARLLVELRAYCARVGVGHALASPSMISWGQDTLVQPDVFVIPMEQARTLQWTEVSVVLLAAAVLSPSSLRTDRFTNRRLYQDRGMPVYWVVDPDAHLVEVWTPAMQFPLLETERLEWLPAG